YPCKLVPGTKSAQAYGQDLIFERHRHRWEVNNSYLDRLAEAGLIVAGTSPDGRLVEIMEFEDHPWFVGVQFHPEFKSRPTRPQPLFRDFVGTARNTLREGDQWPLPTISEDNSVERRPEYAVSGGSRRNAAAGVSSGGDA
ncbi:MAG: gamma-glutamyl-gamma-aminobutyrate hydrolase family protein, partial [Thermomicrobiales bacterium]